MKLRTAACVLLLAAGCRDSRPPPKPSPPAPDRHARETEARATVPDRVLVEVDGVKLTWDEAEAQVNTRMSAAASSTPSDRRLAVRRALFDNVVQQFVLRTLLLNEANRRGIEVSAPEELAAYERIRAALPEGMQLEEVIRQSPIGEQRMRQEVTDGLRISKLLALCLSNAVAVTEDDISEFMRGNEERDQAGRVEREEAVEILKNQRQQQVLAALVQELKEKAQIVYPKPPR